LAFLVRLAVGSSSLNRQDAKDAKQSEKTTDPTAILRAIPSIEAATPIKIFVPFRVVRG
jgi:hypothetical protein